MPASTDLIFPKWQKELLKTILDEQKLRFDPEDQARRSTRRAHRLRHTYICLRLMEGADIHQTATPAQVSR